jgi:O-antigen ligase
MNRIYVWGEGLSALKMQPWGIGKGQFVEQFRMAAHSSYIEAVTEIGLVGLFFWLSLFYFSFRNLGYVLKRKGVSASDEVAVLARALTVTFFSYLLGSLLSSSTYYITLYIYFAIVVVLQNLCSGEIKDECRKISFGDIKNIALIECGLLASIYLWVRIAS